MNLHPNKLADILIGRAAFCDLCKQLDNKPDCGGCKVALLTKAALDDTTDAMPAISEKT